MLYAFIKINHQIVVNNQLKAINETDICKSYIEYGINIKLISLLDLLNFNYNINKYKK